MRTLTRNLQSKDVGYAGGYHASTVKHTSSGDLVGIGGGTIVVVEMIVEVTVDVVVAKTVVVRSLPSCSRLNLCWAPANKPMKTLKYNNE